MSLNLIFNVPDDDIVFGVDAEPITFDFITTSVVFEFSSVVQVNVAGGEGGTNDHSQLVNRNLADQHTITAITGLTSTLALIADDITTLEGAASAHAADYSVHLTADQNAAADAAATPSGANPFATINDLSSFLTVVAWGDIAGLLPSQTDLQSALNAKADVSHVTDYSVHLTADQNAAADAATAPSGTNPFATINDISSFSVAWGEITGTLSAQTDLQSALDAKAGVAHVTDYSVHLTVDQNAAADAATTPSGANPFATVNDLSSFITGIAWGDVTGTLSAQVDLQNALDAKTDIAGTESISGSWTFTTAPTVGDNVYFRIGNDADIKFRYVPGSLCEINFSNDDASIDQLTNGKAIDLRAHDGTALRTRVHLDANDVDIYAGAALARLSANATEPSYLYGDWQANADFVFNTGYKEKVQTISGGSTISCDLQAYTVFLITLDQAATINITNADQGRSGTILLTDGDAYTVTWDTDIEWVAGTAPSLSNKHLLAVNVIESGGAIQGVDGGGDRA